MGPLGPLPWKVMGHILKSWDNDPGPPLIWRPESNVWFHSLPPGKIFHAFLSFADFFQINFFEEFFQKYHQSVKQFGSRSGPTFVSPDLGSNCLQRLSADNTVKRVLWYVRVWERESFYKYQISHLFIHSRSSTLPIVAVCW